MIGLNDDDKIAEEGAPVLQFRAPDRCVTAEFFVRLLSADITRSLSSVNRRQSS